LAKRQEEIRRRDDRSGKGLGRRDVLDLSASYFYAIAAARAQACAAAFDDIRQSAKGNTAVTIRLIDAIDTLAALCREDRHRYALERQFEMLVRSAEEFICEPNDRASAVRRAAAARKSLAANP
jgi:uncharacterized membrane protein